MFSYEIQELLQKNNFTIKHDMYSSICLSSPQIDRIKYDSYNNNFQMWTSDGYYWIFSIRN